MDSICKCEGGFKQKHLSWSLTVSPHISKCSGKKLLEWSSWWWWQDVGTGWLHGGLCVKRPGLPHARYSCFQPALMDTPQSRAEHLSQDGDTAKKMYLRKSMRNSRKTTRSAKKRRKWCFRHQSTDSPGVHGKDLTGAHEYFPTEVHLPGEPVQEQVYPEILQPMGRHTEDRWKYEEE